uniref:Uncharacterized mitochondrial protein AtMg00810-like n=1 Tax=Tanacetum cinerariifolium TaxID=118510 RepID=A0A6L2LK94_TANCI|nr:uncharacterized mitochondrial protein AtMg00810-like [Tanacetum cinerariifolium]
MDSLSPQVVSAVKLPLLNPNEFDLWKMRIEQYFLMTDYSLWEVILNGDSLAPIRVIEGSSSESLDQIHYRPQKLISQLEFLGRNKTDLEEQSLDDLFNSLKIYEAEVKSSSTASTSTQNIAFVSSNTDNNNEPVSAAAPSVSAVSAKIPVSALPNVDTLRRNLEANGPTSIGFDMSKVECYNCHRKGHFARECRSPKDPRRTGAAEPQRRNILSFQAEEEPTNYALMAFTSSSSSFDNEAVSCLKACTKAYAELQSHYDKLTDDYRKSQFDVISYKTGLESVEARLLLRDNALVVLKQNLEKAEQEMDDLKLKLEKFQTSSKSLNELLASQTNDKTSLGYNSQVFTRAMFDCDNYYTSKSDDSLPPSPIYDRPSAPIMEDWVSDSEDDFEPETLQHTEIPKPKSQRKCRNRNAWFVCKSLTHLIKDCDYHEKKMDQTTPRNHANRGTHTQYARMTLPNPQRHVVPTAVLTQSKLVPITAVRQVTTVVPKTNVTRPRQAKTFVTKPHSPPRRHINRSLSPKASTFPPKVIAAKTPIVNVVQGNMSYLSDFEELNGGYVACDGHPKGVPRENNIYNVDLKNIVPSGALTCLFAKATLDESNLWHRRLGHINFKTINKLVKDLLLPIPFWAETVNTACYVQNRVLVTKPYNKTPYELIHGRTPSIGFMRLFSCPVTIPNTLDSLGKFDGKVDEGFLVGYSISSKSFRVFNSRTRIVQETLHVNFLENKPNVVGSGPTWLFDIDTLTKTMNYQPVTVGNQSNPSIGIQEQFNAEKAGEENVQQYVLFPVWSFSSTNPQKTNGDAAFEEKEPEFEGRKPESEVYVSPSKFKDFSDNNINKVNAAGNSVPVVGQIFTDNTNTFSAAGHSNDAVSPTHRKSLHMDTSQLPDDPDMQNWKTLLILMMKKMLEEVYVCQPLGFEDPDYPNKVYKVVKTLYCLHQDPRAWYETLANYLLENGFQRGKVDQTLFIKRQQGDILLVQIYVDDIIFGSTNKDLCKAFEKLMKDKFQMSSMGELTFYLGLQVKQKPDGIFINYDKYVADILRKFGLSDGKSTSTPIDTEKPLLKDPVFVHVLIFKLPQRLHTYMQSRGSLDISRASQTWACGIPKIHPSI